MSSLFRKEVFQQRDQKLDGEVRVARPPSFKWLTALIAGIIFVAGVFVTLGEYPRKESVSGVIEPTKGVLRINAPIAGTVIEVLVREGQTVEADEPLLRLSERRFVPELGSVGEARRAELLDQIQRLARLIEDEMQYFRMEKNDLETRLRIARQRSDNINSRLELMERRLAIQKEALDDAEELSRDGLQPVREADAQRETLLALRQEQQNLDAARLDTLERIENLEQEIRTAPIRHQRNVNDLRERHATATAELRQTNHSQEAELRAPVSGRVSGLTAHPGSNVNLGQVLLRLLPSDSKLEAVLFVPTAAAGNLKVGQEVRLRFDAFPYERYGVYGGRVMEIGETTFFPEDSSSMQGQTEPSYRVIVELPVQSIHGLDRKLPFRPGMTLQADIILEKRSLVNWLFNPIYRVQKAL